MDSQLTSNQPQQQSAPIESFSQIFDFAIERNASDIHIVPNYYPTIRVQTRLVQITTMPILDQATCEKIIFSILNDEQREMLISSKEYDFSYTYKDQRFRFNVYYTIDGISAAARLIPGTIRSLEQLGIPESLYAIAELNEGLVIVNGQTGQGKSSTLAALLQYMNEHQERHIITIEDPIEYVFPKGKSMFSQRELHNNTHSWAIALKSAMREDPDVVMVGEMRDMETMQSALMLAETGHLVLTTLHTTTAAESVNRIVDTFPSYQQDQVRYQLSGVLKYSISQKLLPSAQGTLVPAVEIMKNIAPVANSIREGKIHFIDNFLITNENEGMILFEKYLHILVSKGIVTKEVAVNNAFRTDYMRRLLNL